MIVDSHMHVWSMDDVDYYDDKTIYQYMQENAVDKTAIIAISEKENAEMKKVVQNEPDKFFGLGYVNVRDMYPSLKKLEEGVKGGWIRGIKLYPYAEHFMLDDDAINPVYETCLALDIPVLLHVGFQRSSLVHPSQVGAAPCKCSTLGFPVQFCTVLEKYPKLKLIMAHMGGDTYFQCLSICMRFENAYLDTAWLQYYAENQFPQVKVKDWIEHACKYLSSEKILYGGEGTLPSDILNTDISDQEKENICGGLLQNGGINMYTVVCFGDTNTWGYDNRSGDRLPYDERWTGMLAKELGADFRVIEEGLPGRATTEDPVESGKNARAQIGPCLESHAPIDVFVMMLGQPDLKKRFSLTACDISMGIEALSRMVLSSNAGAGGKPPKLLIMSPVQVGEVAGSPMENWFPAEGTRERSAQLPELYKGIAKKYGAAFLEASSVAATAADAIHIDNSSHAAFALAVADKVRKLVKM